MIEQPRERGDQRQQARRQRRARQHVTVDVGGRLAAGDRGGSDPRRGTMPTSPGRHAAQRRRARVGRPRLVARADRLPGVARRRRGHRPRRRQLRAPRGVQARHRLQIGALGNRAPERMKLGRARGQQLRQRAPARDRSAASTASSCISAAISSTRRPLARACSAAGRRLRRRRHARCSAESTGGRRAASPAATAARRSRPAASRTRARAAAAASRAAPARRSAPRAAASTASARIAPAASAPRVERQRRQPHRLAQQRGRRDRRRRGRERERQRQHARRARPPAPAGCASSAGRRHGAGRRAPAATAATARDRWARRRPAPRPAGRPSGCPARAGNPDHRPHRVQRRAAHLVGEHALAGQLRAGEHVLEVRARRCAAA